MQCTYVHCRMCNVHMCTQRMTKRLLGKIDLGLLHIKEKTLVSMFMNVNEQNCSAFDELCAIPALTEMFTTCRGGDLIDKLCLRTISML